MSPIIFISGVLLAVLSASMLVPALLDYMVDNPDWRNFVTASFVTAFVAGIMVFANKGNVDRISLKQTFILTTATWVFLVAFAALPLYFSSVEISYTDAFFEAMAGLTTSGATVLVGLDTMPPGLILWRALLQWLGGIGIIVLAMAILPILKIGGMQLFRSESSEKSEKVLPKAKQLSMAIGGIYTVFTCICAFTLWISGMSPFDAICHAMTTIATGGFSTHDASIGFFDSYRIEMVVMFFMLASGVPFVLYIQALRGRTILLWQDNQVRWFFALIFFSTVSMSVWMQLQENLTFFEAFRKTSFNVVSIITTTGFSASDYYQWGSFAVLSLFLLGVVGGCTGSTTGGIKIFRFQVLFETAKLQMKQLIQPHGVFQPIYNKKRIDERVMTSVLSFFILFALCFSVLAVMLAATGLDYITSMSAAASALSNLGPGLGPIIGPSGNYAPLNDIAKWLVAAGMLIGRLEVFTVLILFSPYFWRD